MALPGYKDGYTGAAAARLRQDPGVDGERGRHNRSSRSAGSGGGALEGGGLHAINSLS